MSGGGSRQTEFLPTPSARRATNPGGIGHSWVKISTHALREEGDAKQMETQLSDQAISTHALREEGDGTNVQYGDGTTNFYPRPPRGGRHPGRYRRRRAARFLPTPSARRATHRYRVAVLGYPLISTHALREEGDPLTCFPARSTVPISTHALREEGDSARYCRI